ncbi:uncharacterized protein LOC117342697 [Pecten maximus]|uniref:uncharacterized protein LOC117342697 n=1 Tax=Pecten maximus TaxID=6579 RepID=UPI001458CE1E|nr:uncharacterized protein LOC117342697 [Pecten maximus]XP_033760796.1 uncharacterized protein LOC117342697 [Pecten maximus]XP_033760797.1 uncharacterized protein LOC117342697 [Pecten maximus]
MTCRVLSSSWKYIDISRQDPAADVLIARVNRSLITEPLSPRITASQTDEGNVVVTFTKVNCSDAGTYICVMNDDTPVKIQSPDSVLNIRRIPSVPVFDLTGHQIVGSSLNTHHKHKCTGDVGYPAGKFKVQYAAAGSSLFSELPVSNIDNTPSEWLCNSTERTMEFEIDFQPDMDGGVIRCDIYSSDNSLTTYSNNETIELIPSDICTTKDTVANEIHHPNNCKKYVTCYGGPQGYDTCNGKCVKIENGIFHSCVDCSEDVCPKTDLTTTAVSTTTSGPSYLTCGDISGYIGDAASSQCQITSDDFDAVILSHTSAKSTSTELLGRLTKTAYVAMTTDPIWAGLDLVYYIAGSTKIYQHNDSYCSL